MRRPGRGARLGKAALSVALAAYAVLAVGSGLDRLTAQSPPLERLVPKPFRAEADRAAARQAAALGKPDDLQRFAVAAVRADPVDPASTSLLGGARLARGDFKGAEQAFRVSARFGWRDVATQVYWLEASVDAGEVEPAADRLDAVLRARPELAASDRLLLPLEDTAAGRRALAKRLGRHPGWLGTYLQAAGKTPEELRRRTEVLLLLPAEGARLGCDTVSGFVGTAVATGARPEGEAVWSAHCPGANVAGGIVDGEFDRFGRGTQDPFGWQAVPSGDVAADTIEGGGGGRRVSLRNSASVSRLVLIQPVRLSAGTYRLTAKTMPGRIAASVGCGAPPPIPSRVTGEVATSGQLLAVPACDRLMLGLWLRPGEQAVDLDRVEAARVD